MTKKETPIYEVIGEKYAEIVENSPYNAYYERPAMLDLIGDVSGLRVLDIGCGSGAYAQILLNKGALEIIALDNSKKMMEFFRKRLGDRVKTYVADVSERMDFLHNDYFDLIVCPLVLHYVKDWDFVFSEFAKKIKTNGRLVFSTAHPYNDFNQSISKDYFQVELIEEYWESFDMNIKTYRRSMTSILDVLKKNGFRIIDIIEPQPIAELKIINPQTFDKLSKEPTFICFDLLKIS